ncbi:hypothetical protein [Undibacterium sp. TJN19]|uniref:hypothetical protein n=1 Tax=Undibacterium sp. TJN19 TaxID=3413055 RepID=UPI003BF34260
MNNFRKFFFYCIENPRGWLLLGGVAALLWGVPMALFFIAIYPEKSIIKIIYISLFGGFVFGAFFWMLLKSLRK